MLKVYSTKLKNVVGGGGGGLKWRSGSCVTEISEYMYSIKQ